MCVYVLYVARKANVPCSSVAQKSVKWNMLAWTKVFIDRILCDAAHTIFADGISALGEPATLRPTWFYVLYSIVSVCMCAILALSNLANAIGSTAMFIVAFIVAWVQSLHICVFFLSFVKCCVYCGFGRVVWMLISKFCEFVSIRCCALQRQRHSLGGQGKKPLKAGRNFISGSAKQVSGRLIVLCRRCLHSLSCSYHRVDLSSL